MNGQSQLSDINENEAWDVEYVSCVEEADGCYWENLVLLRLSLVIGGGET